jgi:hypothetical protein
VDNAMTQAKESKAVLVAHPFFRRSDLFFFICRQRSAKVMRKTLLIGLCLLIACQGQHLAKEEEAADAKTEEKSNDKYEVRLSIGLGIGHH